MKRVIDDNDPTKSSSNTSKPQSAAEASAEEIQEFKALYFKVYGIELSNAEATAKATKLLNLFEVIWRPLPKSGKES